MVAVARPDRTAPREWAGGARALRSAERRGRKILQKKRAHLSLPLCLSRACLGKQMAFSVYKMASQKRKRGVFLTEI